MNLCCWCCFCSLRKLTSVRRCFVSRKWCFMSFTQRCSKTIFPFLMPILIPGHCLSAVTEYQSDTGAFNKITIYIVYFNSALVPLLQTEVLHMWLVAILLVGLCRLKYCQIVDVSAGSDKCYVKQYSHYCFRVVKMKCFSGKENRSLIWVKLIYF